MSKQRNRTSIRTGTTHVSRPRLSERERRVPTAFWDRIKFVILLAGLWGCGLAIVWTTTVKPIGGPFSDALRIAFHDYSWLLALAGHRGASPAALPDRGALEGVLPLLAEAGVRRGLRVG